MPGEETVMCVTTECCSGVVEGSVECTSEGVYESVLIDNETGLLVAARVETALHCSITRSTAGCIVCIVCIVWYSVV